MNNALRVKPQFFVNFSKQSFKVYFFPNLNPKTTLNVGWKSVCKNRAVFGTQSSIYDLSIFFAKKLNSFYLFEKTETFTMKLRLDKSSRQLQRAAFLGYFLCQYYCYFHNTGLHIFSV